MVRSNIIKELVNDIISIEVALNRTKVIIYELENENLNQWIDEEINGYNNDDIPDYRVVKSRQIKYSGINGRYKITQADLPITIFPNEAINEIELLKVHDSISVLESRCSEDGQIGRSLTHMAAYVYSKTGAQCTSITQYFDKGLFKTILSNVKHRLIDILLKLESEFGNLDNLDINIEKKEIGEVKQINQVLVQIIKDDSIKIGDKNKIDDSNIGSSVNED